MNDSVTLLDGGTGRELLRQGAPFRQPEWSALALMEAPVYVSRVHRAFIDAGADVITTNSYAVVPFHIGDERFSQDGPALAQLSGRLAREAVHNAARRVAVAGSLPPICGSYRADWFDPVFARPILSTLVTALRPSVDQWQAETLSSIEEAELVRKVIGNDAKPLWLSFTLRDDRDAPKATPQLRSGQSVAAAVDACIQLGAQAVMFNCSQPEVMGAALADARNSLASRSSPLQVGIYANAFALAEEAAAANEHMHAIRTDLDPEGYLGWVKQWIAGGAGIVGGCCGIGPEHIAAIRQMLADPLRRRNFWSG